MSRVDPTPDPSPLQGRGEEPGEPLLEVEGLRVEIEGAEGGQPIIDGLSLVIRRGEVVALVGESGSGKSMTALSLMRLLPAGAAITGGSIRFAGAEITTLPAAALDRLRGCRIGMIFQQPQAMLDPTSRVGTQVAEPLRLHRHLDREAAETRAIELLRDVGIPEPALRARCYAYELSGGMAQRVMLAAAMSADPDLLIADEPTTALDVTVQAQILRLLDEQRRKRRMAVLLITHDFSVVAALAERVAVMYAGRIVEEGPTAAVLRDPQHPYTRALVRCSLLREDENGALFSIPSGAVQARDLDCGCRFHPRCATAAAQGIDHRCAHQEPDLAVQGDGRKSRCWAASAAEAPASG